MAVLEDQSLEVFQLSEAFEQRGDRIRKPAKMAVDLFREYVMKNKRRECAAFRERLQILTLKEAEDLEAHDVGDLNR